MRNVVLAIVLAGCTLEPRYERPRLPVASRFPAGEGSLAAADLGWRKMFGDPRLQRLIALALANNRDLRIAALNIEATRAQYRIQRAELFPQVDATGSSFRRGGSAVTSGTPGAGAGLGVPGSVAGGANLTRSYQLGIAASWELDLFGRIRSLSKQALETYLASIEGFRAAHLALVGQVVTQYLMERSFAEQYAVAVRNERATRETYDLMKRMFEGGQRSELDVRAAEAQWQAARADISATWRAWAQAVNALVLLVGQPLPRNLPAPQALAAQQLIADLAPGLPSQVLLRRPDVREAEHRLRAANANIGAARAAFFPNISLTGFIGTVSTAVKNLFASGSSIWSFQPNITQPIFHGGANIANLDLAHVQKRVEIATYERTIQTAFREVADALVARETYAHQLEAQLAAVRASQASFDLSKERYEAGITDYLAVLQAQRDLYVSEQTLIAVRTELLTNLVDLYRALGGGWREN
jgi:multidrug efflux system outer membrane protein